MSQTKGDLWRLAALTLMLAAPGQGESNDRGDSTGEWLRKVAGALETQPSSKVRSLRFGGGSLADFLEQTDFARLFNTSLILRGQAVEGMVGPCDIQGETLEQMLQSISQKFDCSIVAVKGSKFEIMSRDELKAFMERAATPFVLIARSKQGSTVK